MKQRQLFAEALDGRVLTFIVSQLDRRLRTRPVELAGGSVSARECFEDRNGLSSRCGGGAPGQPHGLGGVTNGRAILQVDEIESGRVLLLRRKQ